MLMQSRRNGAHGSGFYDAIELFDVGLIWYVPCRLISASISSNDTQQNTPDVQDDYDTLFPIFTAIAHGVANARYAAYANDHTSIGHY
jgi:hypothetical protein